MAVLWLIFLLHEFLPFAHPLSHPSLNVFIYTEIGERWKKKNGNVNKKQKQEEEEEETFGLPA